MPELRRSRAVGTVAIFATVVCALVTDHRTAVARCHGRHWVGTWATSPSVGTGGPFTDQSLRLVINPTFGGKRVRVRLSNRYGSQPVTLGAVTIARRALGPAVVPESLRILRFAHARAVTIPAGGEVVSDPRRFTHAAFEDVAVSMDVVGESGPVSEQAFALQTSYASPAGSGDQTADPTGAAFTETLTAWPLLTDLESLTAARVGAVVTLGDSITDGIGGPVDENRRYPDLLARRLAAAGLRVPVQVEGVGGNQILRNRVEPTSAPRLLDRLEHDAIDQVGASVVILMEGTNDIGLAPPLAASDVIAGLETVVDRLHRAGFRVILGTQVPCKVFAFPPNVHGSPEAIAKRNEINAWIRTSGVSDGVVDFHAALGDLDDPDRLTPAYDSGDGLHPNGAGYAAMADAIDPGLLRSRRCRVQR